jgi:glycosyltransferase involved in cell wall biosynthesis
MSSAMKICLLGLDNLPVLAPGEATGSVAGEPVQQTLLACALARRGHEVSMVVADHGQEDGRAWRGVTTFKAYRPGAGIPVFRYIHPRWTGIWSALRRADADVYYTSCAGMHVGLLAHFCRRFKRPFVFRIASDSDCDPARLLVRFARDRWLYAFGLRRADAVLAQNAWQAGALERNYGVPSRFAKMLVETPGEPVQRDIDVLWVSNIRRVKRPDRLLALARALPRRQFHIAGGPLHGEEALYEQVRRDAGKCPNVHFHGLLSYAQAGALYSRAKLLVNTSDVEGFPNSYLQAWIRGVPVVSLIDPDGIITREGLGAGLDTPDDFPQAVSRLLASPATWKTASAACSRYMQREYGEETVMSAYVETFDRVLRARGEAPARYGLPTDAAHG